MIILFAFQIRLYTMNLDNRLDIFNKFIKIYKLIPIIQIESTREMNENHRC